jgi:AraC family of transcriptional regulator, multidrug resistance transcriptional activator
MNRMRKRSKPTKKKLRNELYGELLTPETVAFRNQVIEKASLESFAIRFPRLLGHVYFHYTFVADGHRAIGEHAHWHWEITRVCAGQAKYSISGYDKPVVPDAGHYLIIPPKMTHSWETNSAPLLLNGWQIRFEAQDQGAEQVLRLLGNAVKESGFLFPASPEQIQAEKLLWQMSEKKYAAQLFGPVLSGFTHMIIGELLAAINPWPAGSLETCFDKEAASINMANRLKTFLDENILHLVTLKEMESHFHYSGKHLNRIFQNIYKISIGRYLRGERIELAKCWLGTTDRSIKDIALSLGYTSSSQFCRYFMIQNGLTPSQFREINQDMNK